LRGGIEPASGLALPVFLDFKENRKGYKCYNVNFFNQLIIYVHFGNSV